MEMIFVLAAFVVVAIALVMAAPYHHRLIDRRPKVNGNHSQWD